MASETCCESLYVDTVNLLAVLRCASKGRIRLALQELLSSFVPSFFTLSIL